MAERERKKAKGGYCIKPKWKCTNVLPKVSLTKTLIHTHPYTYHGEKKRCIHHIHYTDIHLYANISQCVFVPLCVLTYFMVCPCVYVNSFAERRVVLIVFCCVCITAEYYHSVTFYFPFPRHIFGFLFLGVLLFIFQRCVTDVSYSTAKVTIHNFDSFFLQTNEIYAKKRGELGVRGSRGRDFRLSGKKIWISYFSN